MRMLTFADYLIESFMTAADALALLGLRPGYTDEDLRSAYHRAAMRYHPDKGGDAEMMKKVNVAHSKLSKRSADVEPVILRPEPHEHPKDVKTSKLSDKDRAYVEARAKKREELKNKR